MKGWCGWGYNRSFAYLYYIIYIINIDISFPPFSPSPQALDDKFYITRDGLYQAPHDCSRGRVLEYLKNLPATEGPEVFGMHENADITFQLQETRRAVDAILAMQPRVAAGAGKRPPAEVVAALAAEIGEWGMRSPIIGERRCCQW